MCLADPGRAGEAMLDVVENEALNGGQKIGFFRTSASCNLSVSRRGSGFRLANKGAAQLLVFKNHIGKVEAFPNSDAVWALKGSLGLWQLFHVTISATPLLWERKRIICGSCLDQFQRIIEYFSDDFRIETDHLLIIFGMSSDGLRFWIQNIARPICKPSE